MPYKSQAQAAYFNIHRKELEKQGVDVGEWNKASKGKKLPKKVQGGNTLLPANSMKARDMVDGRKSNLAHKKAFKKGN